MYISLDTEQLEVLREMLRRSLAEMRMETARTDSNDYRRMLHERETVMEQLLAKISEEPRPMT